MTGNRVAHPLLISLADIIMDFRMKASNHAFMLLAILPVPKFLHKNKRIHGVLENRLVHECIDFVVEPLKKAAEIGIMMTDPLGWRRYCFTPLVGAVIDTPEALMYAGVSPKSSPVTMATYKQFGDSFQHEPRTASTTLAQLMEIEETADPWDFASYLPKAKRFRLNGVHRPFWRDWPLVEPSLFLTPEPLHHWHKMFWDHNAKWCIHEVGSIEIDFRFSVLQPHVGYRHFTEGISNLKQVTGREHCNIQRYIVGIIAGAVPRDFLIAIRASVDFRYLSQAWEIDDEGCAIISAALDEFHQHKSAIIEAGARVGKGNRPIDNWYIPKLELMQSVVPNIRANGAPIQYSADVTEHAHITEIKNPARAGNNRQYEAQICRDLDRTDKLRRFELATSVPNTHLAPSDHHSIDPLNRNLLDIGQEHPNNTLATISLAQLIKGSLRSPTNYFEEAICLQNDHRAIRPFRTFIDTHTAFHLNRDPTFKQMTLEEAAEKFRLPDLGPALIDFMHRYTGDSQAIYSIGGRRSTVAPTHIGSPKIQVWSGVRIQSKSFHNEDEIMPSKLVNACPPCADWPLGLYDNVIVNIDKSKSWPQSGLNGQ